MSKRIRVLHILATNRFSGAENVVCQIINLLKDQNIESVYCSPIGPIEESLKNKKINYYSINKLTRKNIKNAITNIKPDIIHVHDRYATVIASLCIHNIPMISQLHGKFSDMKKISINNIVYTLLAIRVKKIICVSNSVNNEWLFSRLYRKKIIVKRNVVDINSKIYKNEIIKYDICFIGRLVYEKNIPRLIKILVLLKNKIPNFRAVICGDGTDKDFLINEIKRNHLKENIDFLGFVNNPLIYISQSKVMIITSRTEGTPMSALECLSLGKPIVSTPTDGLKEIIRHTENGYLSDSDEEIVKYIVDILYDDSKYTKMCEGVRKLYYEINDVTEYQNFFVNLYNNLIKSKENHND